MVEHFLRWRPFGGGHDEIFLEFGISVPDFYQRIRRLWRLHPELFTGVDPRRGQPWL